MTYTDQVIVPNQHSANHGMEDDYNGSMSELRIEATKELSRLNTRKQITDRKHVRNDILEELFSIMIFNEERIEE